MALSLEKTDKAYKILKEYNGENSYIISLKNDVFAFNSLTLNDFHIEYILKNHNFKPKFFNKIIKISDWYGEKKKEDWGLEFIPEKLLVGYYLGQTSNFYHFYVKYRKSQDKYVSCFIPKKAVLTDIFSEDFHNKEIDFNYFNEKSNRTLTPIQEESVKFLTTRKKCILSLGMGMGKTTAAIVASLADEYKHILVICPASVKTNWRNELNLFVDDDDITIVEGSKWKDAKYTIINFDILDNFYEVPTEIVKKKEATVNEDGVIKYVYKEKEVVSKKKDIIEKAMENSQLYQSKFDLIIIDEAHNLSNTTSGRYKIVSDLIKRSNPIGIYELSGTPVTNRPMNLYNLLKLIGAEITKDWIDFVTRYCDAKSFFKKDQRNAFTSNFLKQKHKSSWYDLTYEEKQELNHYLERYCKKIWVTNGASNLDELQERIKHIYLRRDKDELGMKASKIINLLEYDLSTDEISEYDRLWDDYKSKVGSESEKEIEKYKQITEGILLRQWLALRMIPRTVKLANKLIKEGQKLVIFSAFEEEINTLKKEFGDIAVIHNGKLTIKQKDKSIDAYLNDDNVKIILGNLQSTSEGINLVCENYKQSVIFNSLSWLPGLMKQAEDRVYRLTTKHDVSIYYQIFNDTYMKKMLDTITEKENVINTIIIKENDK